VTTIATDGKSMAGDGLCTGDGIIHAMDVRKVFRLSDGRIVGMCGNAYAPPLFVQWLEHGGDPPDLSEQFEALVLHPGGRCQSFNYKCFAIDQSVPAVTGSGGPLALGAMLAGASPAEAVAIACQRNTGSGGTIVVEPL
jgi:hypothetical protein